MVVGVKESALSITVASELRGFLFEAKSLSIFLNEKLLSEAKYNCAEAGLVNKMASADKMTIAQMRIIPLVFMLRIKDQKIGIQVVNQDLIPNGITQA